MEARVSIFGDSITWGASDNEFGGWVARLRNYFDNDPDNEIDIYNLGISGDTTEDLLKRFDAECQARNRHPQTIIFAIGTNDSQYIRKKENPCISTLQFKENLEKLIEKAKKYSDKVIFVGLTRVDESKVMPTSWTGDKFYDNENIAEYDVIIEKICEKHKLSYISTLDLLKDSDLDDGLHPNSEGHKKMFLRIKDYLFTNKLVD
jgi:acyl-CoA thioesterase I